MTNLLGAGFGFFEQIIKSFSKIGTIVGLDYIFIGALGLLVVLFLLAFILIRCTYEFKIDRNVKKINAFLTKNPVLTDENLVEINKKFKQVPKTFRSAWQEYVLNRDKLPSEYMSTLRCVDQPSKNSTLNNLINASTFFTIAIAFLSMLFNAFTVLANDDAFYEFPDYFLRIGTTPLIVLIIGLLVVAFIRLWFSYFSADLYDDFHDFERLINKSCSTMPAYIDYEVLFTEKEIREGIPVLQEYLEKRAIQEQREREEAQFNSIKFEDFDFDEVGVENALLLERAMKECEKYFNAKHMITENIMAKEDEINKYQKNFDEVTKEFERKSQAFRETIEQLTEQLNNTTIKIEANYINKRKNDAQKQLQELEKEYEIAAGRFVKQQSELEEEVRIFKEDIESRKQVVEDSMRTEGKNYANKVYGHINKTVAAQNEPYLRRFEQERANLEEQVNTLNQTIAIQQAEIKTKNATLENLEKELNLKLAEVEAIKNVRDYLSSNEFRTRVVDGKKRGKNDIRGFGQQEEDEFTVELKNKLSMAEEQLRIANQQQQFLKEREAELMNKLKELDKSTPRTQFDPTKQSATPQQPARPAAPVQPGQPAAQNPQQTNVARPGQPAANPAVQKPVTPEQKSVTIQPKQPAVAAPQQPAKPAAPVAPVQPKEAPKAEPAKVEQKPAQPENKVGEVAKTEKPAEVKKDEKSQSAPVQPKVEPAKKDEKTQKDNIKDELSKLNESINKENQNLLNQQKDLKKNVDTTIDAIDDKKKSADALKDLVKKTSNIKKNK